MYANTAVYKDCLNVLCVYLLFISQTNVFLLSGRAIAIEENLSTRPVDLCVMSVSRKHRVSCGNITKYID